MRRDHFDVEFSAADEPPHERPVIAITYDGPDGVLAERLSSGGGTLDADELDVTYRSKTADDEGRTGVLSIADRITGEFVLETNVAPETVEALVGDAADADDKEYRIRLTDSDGESTVYDKDLLLVYDADGSLRRSRSLIPGGVEL